MSVYIGSGLVLSEISPGGAETANHARIGYQTYGRTGTWSASTEEINRPALQLKYAQTTKFWQPTASTSWVKLDAGSAVTVDYVGLVGLYSGLTLTLEYSNDDASWTAIDTRIVASNKAIMYLFDEIDARYWRMSFSGGIPSLAVMYVGQVLIMERGVYGGFSPPSLSRSTGYTTNITETGQFAGRSIVKRGFQTSVPWDNLTANWYRANFDPFVESARSYPFFIAWRPDQYPEEIVYAWTNNDIKPSNQGQRDLMEVSIDLECHSYE